MKTSADKKYTFQQVLKVWMTDRPHFDGAGPHRYSEGDKYCLYCLKPKDFDPTEFMPKKEL